MIFKMRGVFYRESNCYFSLTRFANFSANKENLSVNQNLINSFSGLKGTVLEVLSRRMPTKDLNSLVKWWGLGKSTSPITIEIQAIKDNASSENKCAENIAGKNKELSRLENERKRRIDEILSKPSTESHLLHPIFGEILVDLSFKKVYLSNVQSLAMAPVWEKQRILRPERAQRIAKAKSSKKSIPGIPGVITMFMDSSTNRCGIIDGQHRVAALVIMAQEGKWDLTHRNIMVDVFTINEEQDISNLFHEINSAEPVRLVDMPGELVDDNVRQILNEVTDNLSLKYPEMFKPSQRCRPPHLNVDVFRDELFQSQFLTRHNIHTTEDLEKLLMNVNQKLSQRKDEDWNSGSYISSDSGAEIASDMKKGKSLSTALKKAKEYNFFLGLDKNWMNTTVI